MTSIPPAIDSDMGRISEAGLQVDGSFMLMAPLIVSFAGEEVP